MRGPTHGWIIILLVLPLIFNDSDAKRYDGYKLLRVEPQDETQLKIINDLEEDPKYEVDFWAEPVANHSIDMLVPPHTYDVFRAVMDALEIPYELHSDNIQYLIEHEMDDDDDDNNAEQRDEDVVNGEDIVDEEDVMERQLRNMLRRVKRAQRTTGNLNTAVVGNFARHQEINDWLEEMSERYPYLAKTQTIGESYEGRHMKIIRISSASGDVASKPALWIDGGIHAREWISPSTAVYIIDQLLRLYGKDDVVTYLVDTYEWLILPVSNPDGYEFTHTEDRLWRKNRHPLSEEEGYPHQDDDDDDRCVGVDLNRNFDFKWNESCPSNVFSQCYSTNPCSQTFRGAAPFTEPESRAIRDILEAEHKVGARSGEKGTSAEENNIQTRGVPTRIRGDERTARVVPTRIRGVPTRIRGDERTTRGEDRRTRGDDAPRRREKRSTREQQFQRRSANVRAAASGADQDKDSSKKTSQRSRVRGSGESNERRSIVGETPPGRVRLYVSLHCYSQLWLLPWACCEDLPLQHKEQVDAVGRAGMEQMQKVHGTNYTTGAPSKILYSAHGTSMDWAQGGLGIKYSFTLELRDKGEYGFLLPRSQVKDVGTEVMAGLVAAILEMGRQEGDAIWTRGVSNVLRDDRQVGFDDDSPSQIHYN